MKIFLDNGTFTPTRGHPMDAGLDLRAPYSFTIKAFDSEEKVKNFFERYTGECSPDPERFYSATENDSITRGYYYRVLVLE